ncbi:MAG: DUF262 domain-containing protein [Planctomycetes bacterium]|nr:DUF262 domain-containing protein [Planctomycetota bacterium]
MEEPRSFDSLFKEKLFRIPDYQRGYSWQVEHLKAFWEDLINLSDVRSHYTGVLTLKQIPTEEIAESDKEYWLVEDHSYKLYHIVDGQQRLTTFIIFLQTFVELLAGLAENSGKKYDEIYITDSLSLTSVCSKYLYKTKPIGDMFRTYKFGYSTDNPSDKYLRYKILGEEGGGDVAETFYTLNLNNAKHFFAQQLSNLYQQEGMSAIRVVYKKLTKKFIFNEYIIKDEFDVFVAFETMNNRGKKLSDLELLKNRLIYLTTLYSDQELDAAERKSLRDTINEAWKMVYHQLGRNKFKPLNDDDFLRAHWTMYFKYSRQTGRDYIKFLLEEQFTPQKVHEKIIHEVSLETAQEQVSDIDIEDEDIDNGEIENGLSPIPSAQLSPTEIQDFVLSLKESSVHWFSSFYPHMEDNISNEEQQWIERLNRIGMVYFRPLVMAILKSNSSAKKRIKIFKQIERFIFIVFRISRARANYRSSEFYNAARELDRDEIDFKAITNSLNEKMEWTFHEDGLFRIDDFHNFLHKKFESRDGYYSWAGLRYFLFEYELSLLSEAVHKKVEWNDLLKTSKDKVSIEHIYPQTETTDWAIAFKKVKNKYRSNYKGSLGNLLLLSLSINSSLQNDSFAKKKKPQYTEGKKIRNGYADGSHSEIEVSSQDTWGPDQIRERGLKLLEFMEQRWDFKFQSQEDREELLLLPVEKEE